MDSSSIAVQYCGTASRMRFALTHSPIVCIGTVQAVSKQKCIRRLCSVMATHQDGTVGWQYCKSLVPSNACNVRTHQHLTGGSCCKVFGVQSGFVGRRSEVIIAGAADTLSSELSKISISFFVAMCSRLPFIRGILTMPSSFLSKDRKEMAKLRWCRKWCRTVVKMYESTAKGPNVSSAASSTKRLERGMVQMPIQCPRTRGFYNVSISWVGSRLTSNLIEAQIAPVSS